MRITIQIIFMVMMLVLACGTVGEIDTNNKRTYIAGAIGFGFLLVMSLKYL